MPEIVTGSILVATGDEIFARDFQRSGIDVTHTNNGFDAVRIAASNRPDMIILDSTTGGLPCQTVALWLKLNPATASIPVIGLIDGVNTWDEAGLDAIINRKEAVAFTVDLVPRLDPVEVPQSLTSTPSDAKPFDPLAVSLDLIEIYRERLRLATSMIDIASIQHDQRDFEYVIKVLLDAAGRNLDSPMMAIALRREHALYVLVRDNSLSVSDLDVLERACLDGLKHKIGNRSGIDDQIVFGRRKLAPSTASSNEPYIFGSIIGEENDPLGYVAGIGSQNEIDKIHYMSLLPDLVAQIAQLLNGADNIREQDEHVGELASVLRAAVETSKISPYVATNNKAFLLQFLLIILDLCSSEQGSIILLDDETKEVKEIAVLGCTEAEILALPYQNGVSLGDSLQSLSPREVKLEKPEESEIDHSRLIAPMTLGDKVLGCLVVLGMPSAPSPRMDQALKTLSGLGGYLVYNRCVHNRAIDSAIIEEQLKLAREIQEDMVPDLHPEIPGYDIFGASVAATQVGGDFFDYLPFDDGRLGIAIGDVAGKAIPASILMTMTRALVMAACERSSGPDQVLKDVNVHLSNRVTNGRFVTASLLTINDDRLTYASAGHQPLLIYRAEIDKFEDVNADGIAMGIIDQMNFEKVDLVLNEGDVALMYTDGLNETRNSSREDFGYENIRKVLRENASGSAREIVDSLFGALVEHMDGVDVSDDTTILAIKRIAEKDHDHGN